jgi:hypothetical protein
VAGWNQAYDGKVYANNIPLWNPISEMKKRGCKGFHLKCIGEKNILKLKGLNRV